MTNASYQMRTGSVQGVKHVQFGINNQDSVQALQFTISAWGKTYRIGVVSDGCTGIPSVSRSEVGSNLLTVFCIGRIQELIVGGVKVSDIPAPLYYAVTNFLNNLSNLVMPANIFWPYPSDMEFTGDQEYRNTLTAAKRFMTDYLAATIVGFVDDGTTLVTFQAGDGARIVNNDIYIADQDNRPEYPIRSVNAPGQGFDVQTYASADVQRVAVGTDGLNELLRAPSLGIADLLFTTRPDNPLGLEVLLRRLRKQHEEMMGDDCAVATMLRVDGAP